MTRTIYIMIDYEDKREIVGAYLTKKKLMKEVTKMAKENNIKIIFNLIQI